MKIGDRIVWEGAGTGLTDPTSLKEGTVTKMRGSGAEAFCWIDNAHKAEDCLYQAFCFPAAARGELVEIMQERGRLKKAYDDSMGLIYELKNRIARGEL
jgi:hypothetical protein